MAAGVMSASVVRQGVAVCVGIMFALCLCMQGCGAGETFRMRSPKQVERVVNKVIREQITKERANGETSKDKPFSGFGIGSPLHDRAKAEATERQFLRERKSMARLTQALLPQIDHTVIAALPMSAGDAGAAPIIIGEDGAETTTSDGDGGQVALSERSVAAYKESMKLLDDVSVGAIANTGALPRDSAQWVGMAQDSENRLPELRSGEVHWLLGSGELEDDDALGLEEGEVVEDSQLAADMLQWFTDGGGQLRYVEADDDATELSATEPLSDNELIIKMPLKLSLSQISARNIKTRSGYLGHHMKDIFKMNQRWGLAMMLLHEHFKDSSGGGSKWGPFLRTLRVEALSKRVMKETQGSYAAELYRRWNEDAEELAKWVDRKHFCLHHGVCMRNGDSIVPGSFTRSDIKWAMWVVRSYAINIYKTTTKKPFLALVPYVNLLRHTSGAGGSITLQMDNTVEVRVGMHSPGDAIAIDLGTLSDAETFLKYHTVSDEDNDYNFVHLSLPGGGGSRADMFWQLDTLRKWRREMGLPPRLSDLWRVTESLHLFGDDEEEQKLLSRANTRIAGLPLPTDQATAEEQLMMLNGVDASQAALMVVGDDAEEYTAQLYAAPDPEDDERAQDAMNDLAKNVLQLQRSVAAGQVDNATLTVINKTKNFLQHGVMPWRGLDEIDQLLLRKLSVLKQCGNESMHRINTHNVSDELWCALRVHTVNQTDMEIVCPKAEGPWFEPQCEDDSFNSSLPISESNERAVLQALRGTVHALLEGYSTTVEQDEALLVGTTAEEGGNGLGPLARAAVLMRMREKHLLHGTLAIIDEREAALPNMTFQITSRAKALKEKAERRAAEERRLKRLQAELEERRVAVVVPVTIDEGKTVNMTIMEDENLEVVVPQFVANNSLPRTAVATLMQAARDRAPYAPVLELAMPVVTPDGRRRVLPVFPGQNVTEEAEKFCMAYNITGGAATRVVDSAKERHAKRMNRSIVVVVPVTGLDGRHLQLVVRQGEQHDLYATTLDFCTVHHMPEAVVLNLANEVARRLPGELVKLPVSVPGSRQLQLRVLQGHDPKEVVEGFCEAYGLPEENVPVLLRRVHAGLHPGAHIV